MYGVLERKETEPGSAYYVFDIRLEVPSVVRQDLQETLFWIERGFHIRGSMGNPSFI